MKKENRFPEGFIPKDTREYKLESLSWEEVENLGKLSRENKIKVTGTGRRTLRIAPLNEKF